MNEPAKNDPPITAEQEALAALNENQVRCSCGEVFTSDGRGVFTLPDGHDGHIVSHLYRHDPVAGLPLEPVRTDADYRAALHNPETPQPVKRAIKQHLHGSPGGRREVRQQYNMSHTITAGERTSSGPKRPAGVSARQWKKQRSAVRRVMKAIEARA